MAIIIDGKAEALRLRAELRGEVTAMVASGRPVPGLRVVIVGNHPASRSYVRTKTKVAAELGIDGALVELPEDVTTADLLAVVGALNDDPATHGILVQLPLPAAVDASRILEAIDPLKDVDGFHPLNVGRLFAASRPLDQARLVPCTPLGCMRLLERVHGAGGLAGAHAVVVGRSNIVGKPMAALLLGADCTVTVAHSQTRDLRAVCRRADVLVAAVGRPHMIGADWVKPGATVLDVGINRIEGPDGPRLVGDVDFARVREVAGALTPVPGGVGPMTVASLMRNTLTAYRLQVGTA
jgi:methylenetetrahydrofolate dehydrogenase (NADP+)/methenyltetrahydrofolate cyclohydrolase